MNLKARIVICCLLIAKLSFILAACNRDIEYKKTDFVLGTVGTITAYGSNSKEAVENAFLKINEIEHKMTITSEKSEVMSINKKSGIDWVRVSQDTFNVIERSIYFSKLTNGSFDITIGSIVKLWNESLKKGEIPSYEKIQEKLSSVNFHNVLLDRDIFSVKLLDEKTFIDLGGIAKGFAVDESARILNEYGIKSGIINLGGDVRVIGNKPDNTLWRIGVQDHQESKGNFMAVVELEEKSIVTSGDYERFYEIGDESFHHIFDPNTGYPADKNLSSVTIISDSTIVADVVSTAVFVMGIKEGLKLIDSIENTEGVIVNKDEEVYLTKGIENSFSILNDKYKIVN